MHFKTINIVILLFITLGPMKVLLPFVHQTVDLNLKQKQKIAFKAFMISTIIVLLVAIIGPRIIDKWGVSTTAIAIAGAFVLFAQAFRQVNFDTSTASLELSKLHTKASIIDRIAYSLSIPYIVTPAGIATILMVKIIHPGHWLVVISTVIAILLTIMILNFLTMLFAQTILKVISIPILQLTGWIFCVLQLILSVQIVLAELQNLGIIGSFK